MRNMIRGILIALMLGITSIYASSDVIHKVVIQVDSGDLQLQNLALNNAVNLQKFYGIDNVKVEVVAYGPGLSILTNRSKFSKRVSSLAMSDVKFSACHNTMQKIKNKTGKLPILSEGVKIVPAGVVRIVQLEDQGYRYIRP